jgi:hypothetical protein
MVLRSFLPINRALLGTIQAENDEGKILAGPFPARGKADNQDAAAHQNPERYPTRPYGDHPYGEYRVQNVVLKPVPAHSFGPVFFLLDPERGDALSAKLLGRTGLGIHGGDPGSGANTLRATDGCLRTTNEAMLALVALNPEGSRYICEEPK